MLPEHQGLYDAIRSLLEDQRRLIAEKLDAQAGLMGALAVSQAEVVETISGLRVAVTAVLAVCPLVHEGPVRELLIPPGPVHGGPLLLVPPDGGEPLVPPNGGEPVHDGPVSGSLIPTDGDEPVVPSNGGHGDSAPRSDR